MINLDVDDLKLYIGDDYVINDNIKVLQPTIRQIAEFGEKDFFSVVHTITAIPSIIIVPTIPFAIPPGIGSPASIAFIAL